MKSQRELVVGTTMLLVGDQAAKLRYMRKANNKLFDTSLELQLDSNDQPMNFRGANMNLCRDVLLL